jgi:hypothetical protein
VTTTKRSSRVSAETERRIRDYAVTQPSFTIPFMAWELGISSSAATIAAQPLIERGVVRQIEPRCGPYAAVYAYVEPQPAQNGGATRRRLPLPELDAGLGLDAPARGVIVPHTGTEGPSGKPGRDRKRQEKGVRVKRQRQGT